MSLPRRYNPRTQEPRIQVHWEQIGVHRFSLHDSGPVYSIDTPPATVSGRLHMGHTYSYSQPDFMARYWRMQGHNVFYPMGYDDNGLPTGRYVEKQLGIRANEMDPQRFAAQCVEMGRQAGQEYERLWRRLGLSVDWRHTYRTIAPETVAMSQSSFIDLYEKGFVYRQTSPTIWCPECQTAIAQAELDDLDRETTFYQLAFGLPGEQTFPIATTRPELLPACVAVFVHPEDERYKHLVGQHASVPLFGQPVPILADAAADPTKGTGAVMCCTFGDLADVIWWRTHNLPLIPSITPDGRLGQAAREFAGHTIPKAREAIVHTLDQRGLLLGRQVADQSVRVHERCDTPTEYIATPQWFIRLLDHKPELLRAGEQLEWHPAHMKARYLEWVHNLNWDWCISRQRTFGVPFPLWTCQSCGRPKLARPEQLPVDPRFEPAEGACACGSRAFRPEMDVMDTWATSALTPQIATAQLCKELNVPPEHVLPMSLRPQAHDIIRTWAFYTIVKSLFHYGRLPWASLAISGWGIAGEGMGKISKSRGGGPIAPDEAIQRYSADAVRYWAASTGLGKDAVISEQKIEMGSKLVTKLWNLARFAERFIAQTDTRLPDPSGLDLTMADRWILSQTQQLIGTATSCMDRYEYAAAKNEAESFLWHDLADNYVEMAKMRLYGRACPAQQAAASTLRYVLRATMQLLAPFIPHVTDVIYQSLFAADAADSIHRSRWPEVDASLIDPQAETVGAALIDIATAVRRFKSENNLPLSARLSSLSLASPNPDLRRSLEDATPDLASIARADQIEVLSSHEPSAGIVLQDGLLSIAVTLDPGQG